MGEDRPQPRFQSSYDVIAVGDGREALNAAIEHHPDLVLTDVMMPNLDGFGLLGELRANVATASIPVIMLSARAGEESRVEGLQAGADDYLVKPFSARELLARVGGLLALTRVREEAHRIERRQAEELARANEALVRAQESLKDADRRKDEFIATLSHELRTPLTAILGWSSLLKSGGNDEETIQTAIDTIEQSARVQAQLIDDVLDVSRITSGKVRISSERIDVAVVAASAIDTVRLAAAARGVRLILDRDEGGVFILGDANRMQQVIWNLLSNAIKFTPEGGEVRLGVRDVGQGIKIQVRDTGIGIKPDFLPHAFEAFRQAESTSTRVHGGLGLGLSIVRYLVELHGGQIIAESEGEGKGATFTIELPGMKPIAQEH